MNSLDPKTHLQLTLGETEDGDGKSSLAEFGYIACEGGNSVHFSSIKMDWKTPQALFDVLNTEFAFTLDPCADPDNTKCKRFYTDRENGLEQSWAGERVWMNPPYGRSIGKWIRKAYEESKRGAVVVCLIPSRTDTNWWHTYCMCGEIIFIKGRLNFSGHKHNAPFPSAIVIFGRGQQA